jgi:hypothetical protein
MKKKQNGNAQDSGKYIETNKPSVFLISPGSFLTKL